MVLRETPVSRSSADMVRTSAMLALPYSTLVDAVRLGAKGIPGSVKIWKRRSSLCSGFRSAQGCSGSTRLSSSCQTASLHRSQW